MSEQPEPRIYRIRRYRLNGGARTIKANVTLSIARLHCNDPRTRKPGVWFDGYDYMPGCAPKKD